MGQDRIGRGCCLWGGIHSDVRNEHHNAAVLKNSILVMLIGSVMQLLGFILMMLIDWCVSVTI
jgi:hypothetical protein